MKRFEFWHRLLRHPVFLYSQPRQTLSRCGYERTHLEQGAACIKCSRSWVHA